MSVSKILTNKKWLNTEWSGKTKSGTDRMVWRTVIVATTPHKDVDERVHQNMLLKTKRCRTTKRFWCVDLEILWPRRLLKNGKNSVIAAYSISPSGWVSVLPLFLRSSKSALVWWYKHAKKRHRPGSPRMVRTHAVCLEDLGCRRIRNPIGGSSSSASKSAQTICINRLTRSWRVRRVLATLKGKLQPFATQSPTVVKDLCNLNSGSGGRFGCAW